MSRRSVRLSTQDVIDNARDKKDLKEEPDRPRKRQKKVLNSKVPRKDTRRSWLEHIPLDILFEIMAYLEPNDMISLARTNHAFRNHLMSRNAQLLWERARDVVDAPAPPPNCSEPKWANLLFGGTKCQHCGATRAIRVEFALCIRLCAKCRDQKLVLKRDVPSRFPDCDPDVLALLPHTIISVGVWNHGGVRKSWAYWEGDIPAMHERLAQLKSDVALKKPEAEQALTGFKQEQTEIVAKTEQVVDAAKQWLQDSAERKKRARQDKEDRRKAEIIDAFVGLGYKSDDVNKAILGIAISTKDTSMSAAAWTRAKKKYEPLIIDVRDQRLYGVRAAVLKRIFNDWVKALSPDKWAHLPPIGVLSGLPAVKEAFQTSCRDIENPTVEDCVRLTSRLPDICTQWETTMTTLFMEMFTKALESEEEVDVRQELAVVRCGYCMHAHVGIDEWLGHPWLCPRQPNTFSAADVLTKSWLHIIGIPQVKWLHALINLLGEDPQKITTQELDERNARFFCTFCDRMAFKHAFSWRQFINHTCTGVVHYPVLATIPGELQAIHEREAQLSIEAWLCTHCTEPYGASLPLSVIREHLYRVHDVQEPLERQDYMWDDTQLHLPSNSVMIHTQTYQFKDVHLEMTGII